MEAKTQGYGTIGWGLSAARYGHPMRRAGWAPEVSLIFDPVTKQFLLENGETASTWRPQQADLMADDWRYTDPVPAGESHA